MTEILGGELAESSAGAGNDAAALALVVSGTPGSVLRRAREDGEHSIADVVQVIRFSARQIEALERDDYANLPGSTAVRGMVRNYAKFLKLDAAPLLAQLDPAVPVAEADVRPPSNMGEAEQPGIIDHVPAKWIVAGLAVLALGLATYWYLALPGDAGIAQRISGLMRGSAPASAPATSGADAAAVPVAAPAPSVISSSPVDTAGVTMPPQPTLGLRVEFDDQSWIEIRDATQKVVFVGEYPAGTRQNVDGKAPFQIWIGRASAVRVFMGERGIDLKPHTREEVARFSLE